jgi:DNA-binding MarR family transcriptional regulator
MSQPSRGQTAFELAPRLRFAINRLNRRLRQHSGTGLTLSLQSALVTIDSQGPINLSELALAEQVAPPTVTKIVRKLEAEGLVTREQDPGDARATLVSSTPAGHSRIAASRSRREAWLAVRLSELDADQLHRLAAAVDVLEHLARAEDRT